MAMHDDIKQVLTDPQILAIGTFGQSPLKRLEHGRAIEREVLAVLDDREGRQPLIARPLAEWHEEDGPVMWWAWCGHEWAGEPAWCATPNSSDWPGYHTHWTAHPALPAPAHTQRAKGDDHA